MYRHNHSVHYTLYIEFIIHLKMHHYDITQERFTSSAKAILPIHALSFSMRNNVVML